MPHQKTRLRRPEIYGLLGQKGHGKDSFAQLIQTAVQNRAKKGTPFTILHFADPLKHMACQIFGLTLPQCNDPQLKEQALPQPLALDLYLGGMCRETGLSIRKAEKIAYTPREVLQYFGTDYVRAVQSDYWIQVLVRTLRGKRRVLIADCRFPDEAQALRNLGAKLIRITRIDTPTSTDTHASELQGRSIAVDLEIGTRTDITWSLQKRVATLVAWNRFEGACRYHYPTLQKAFDAYLTGTPLEEVASTYLRTTDETSLAFALDYYQLPRRSRAGKRTRVHELREGVVGKVCSVCRIWSGLQAFNLNAKSWDGHHSICRPCASQANQRHYQRYCDNRSWSAFLKRVQRNAAQRGLLCTLTLTDLENLWTRQQGKCAYTQLPLNWEIHSAQKLTLDRIDSQQGYTAGNVCFASCVANIMKGSLSSTEFQYYVRLIYVTLEGKLVTKEGVQSA